MNIEYSVVADKKGNSKVKVVDENYKETTRDYVPNIDKLLVQENLLEIIDNDIDKVKKKIKKKKIFTDEMTIVKNHIHTKISFSWGLIFIIAFILICFNCLNYYTNIFFVLCESLGKGMSTFLTTICFCGLSWVSGMLINKIYMKHNKKLHMKLYVLKKEREKILNNIDKINNDKIFNKEQNISSSAYKYVFNETNRVSYIDDLAEIRSSANKHYKELKRSRNK